MVSEPLLEFKDQATGDWQLRVCFCPLTILLSPPPPLLFHNSPPLLSSIHLWTLFECSAPAMSAALSPPLPSRFCRTSSQRSGPAVSARRRRPRWSTA